MKHFVYGLMVCLALGAALPAHADDEVIAGSDGTVYRTSPAQAIAQPATFSAPAGTSYRDRSGVGNFNIQGIARGATQYHQPTNHSNRSSVYR